MTYPAIPEDANEFPLFRVTANNVSNPFAAIVPLPFIENRAQTAVAVANWMGTHTAMTERSIWAQVSVANDSSVAPASDPGGEASDKYFNIRLIPAGMTAADAFTIGVKCPRFLTPNANSVELAGQALAAIYDADPGVESATYIPNNYGR